MLLAGELISLVDSSNPVAWNKVVLYGFIVGNMKYIKLMEFIFLLKKPEP